MVTLRGTVPFHHVTSGNARFSMSFAYIDRLCVQAKNVFDVIPLSMSTQDYSKSLYLGMLSAPLRIK
jgi:hypothetical protein